MTEIIESAIIEPIRALMPTRNFESFGKYWADSPETIILTRFVGSLAKRDAFKTIRSGCAMSFSLTGMLNNETNLGLDFSVGISGPGMRKYPFELGIWRQTDSIVETTDVIENTLAALSKAEILQPDARLDVSAIGPIISSNNISDIYCGAFLLIKALEVNPGEEYPKAGLDEQKMQDALKVMRARFTDIVTKFLTNAPRGRGQPVEPPIAS